MAKVHYGSLILFLILATTILLSLVCATSRLIATGESTTTALLFTNADGTACEQPCLLGIRPGQTYFNQALDLIQKHPFTRIFALTMRGDVFISQSLQISLYKDSRERITSIHMVTNRSQVDQWGLLGQVVSALGPPTRIEVSSRQIRSYYYDGHVTFVHRYLNAGRISVNDILVNISVSEHVPDVPLEGSPSGVPIRWEYWQGFGSIRRYPPPHYQAG